MERERIFAQQVFYPFGYESCAITKLDTNQTSVMTNITQFNYDDTVNTIRTKYALYKKLEQDKTSIGKSILQEIKNLQFYRGYKFDFKYNVNYLHLCNNLQNQEGDFVYQKFEYPGNSILTFNEKNDECIFLLLWTVCVAKIKYKVNLNNLSLDTIRMKRLNYENQYTFLYTPFEGGIKHFLLKTNIIPIIVDYRVCNSDYNNRHLDFHALGFIVINLMFNSNIQTRFFQYLNSQEGFELQTKLYEIFYSPGGQGYMEEDNEGSVIIDEERANAFLRAFILYRIFFEEKAAIALNVLNVIISIDNNNSLYNIVKPLTDRRIFNHRHLCLIKKLLSFETFPGLSSVSEFFSNSFVKPFANDEFSRTPTFIFDEQDNPNLSESL